MLGVISPLLVAIEVGGAGVQRREGEARGLEDVNGQVESGGTQPRAEGRGGVRVEAGGRGRQQRGGKGRGRKVEPSVGEGRGSQASSCDRELCTWRCVAEPACGRGRLCSGCQLRVLACAGGRGQARHVHKCAGESSRGARLLSAAPWSSAGAVTAHPAPHCLPAPAHRLPFPPPPCARSIS